MLLSCADSRVEWLKNLAKLGLNNGSIQKTFWAGITAASKRYFFKTFLAFLSYYWSTLNTENSIWLCILACRSIQYIPRNMHTVFALLCFVVVIHWLIFPHPSGLLHWHCGNLTIAPVPAKQPWWIWINTSCEFIMNDCITTTKQSTTKPCAYFLGYTVSENTASLLFNEKWFHITVRPLISEISVKRSSMCSIWYFSVYMFQYELHILLDFFNMHQEFS